jgi:hypothetical protein
MSVPTRPFGNWLRRYSLVLVAAVGGAAGVAYAAGWHRTPAKSPQPVAGHAVTAQQIAAPAPTAELPKDTVQDTVQIALVLDTSSSMDGLINQARSHMWSLVDQMGKLTREVNGKQRGVKIELALYEYGNQTIDGSKGYIRQVLPFSSDLDTVSEKLHSLFTNGGDEYAGQAIKTAVSDLQWSSDPSTLKFIYLAGNEELTQGPVTPGQAIEAARAKDINVQFILCGDNDDTWKTGAKLAQSDLMTIDQSKVAAHIPAPQDDEILRLNGELNTTYMGYGALGSASMARQASADAGAYKMSKKVALERSQLKAKKAYDNSSWDLVDATDKNAKFLDTAKDGDLPAELQGKTAEEKKALVAAKAQQRADLKAKIAKLEADRTTFLATERAKTGAKEEKSLETELMKSTKHVAGKKGYK